MIKTYIVEDNQDLLDDITYCLSAEGHDCQGANNASAFDILMAKQTPDIVILDWSLLGEDGLSIAQRLRNDEKTCQIGIIFLTAKDSLDARLLGLDVADSYLVKPIDFQELSAIISSVHRRTATNNSQSVEPTWQLHKKKMELHTPLNEIISLSYRECLALQELTQSHNKPISSRHIVESWDENWLLYEKNRLELFFSRLRAKIRKFTEGKFNPIRSIRHEGYMLMIAVELND